MPFPVSGIFAYTTVMYSKPTTICSSIALEKGVLVAASGDISECAVKASSTSVSVGDFDNGGIENLGFGDTSWSD